MLAQNTIQSYAPIGILLLVTVVMAIAMVAISHVLSTHRSGPVKDTPYESGMPVIGDARRRFNVKFYLVAMMFLLFDVEVVLLWPWAQVFHTAATEPDSKVAQHLAFHGLEQAPSFLLVAGGLFFSLLLVGFLYDLGKGIFRWS